MTQVYCRCAGTNSDCYRCDGRGYHDSLPHTGDLISPKRTSAKSMSQAASSSTAHQHVTKVDQ